MSQLTIVEGNWGTVILMECRWGNATKINIIHSLNVVRLSSRMMLLQLSILKSSILNVHSRRGHHLG